MFVIDPDPFLLPTYRISPFKTEHITTNAALPEDDFAEHYFNQRFGKGHWHYTFNGREAIYGALQHYNLERNDLVTILTTSDNFYISSCVTKTIEMFCDWNREILPETKVILVNHEFGYPYEDMEKIKSLGLPIIEDCCTTFFSQDNTGKVGDYGDFSTYSFPKFFPIQIGGLLVSKQVNAFKSQLLDEQSTRYIGNVLSYYLRDERKILDQRQRNLEYAESRFLQLGFTARFPIHKNTVPSALVLNNHSLIKDLNALKSFLNSHGVQNSIFYGEDAFFIPIHQNLTNTDIDYIITLIEKFAHLKNLAYVRPE